LYIDRIAGSSREEGSLWNLSVTCARQEVPANRGGRLEYRIVYERPDVHRCFAIYFVIPVCVYSGRDEKIGKKDQQDDLGSEVEREALWKKIGFV